MDRDRFRAVFAQVPTAVTVIAALVDDEPAGLTVGTFVPVSLDPALVAFFVARTSTSWPKIERGGGFAASILNRHQGALSAGFAVSGGDKFAGVNWWRSPSGHPVITDAVAWIDCRIESQRETGDHLLVLATPTEMDRGEELPLLHHRGASRVLLAEPIGVGGP